LSFRNKERLPRPPVNIMVYKNCILFLLFISSSVLGQPSPGTISNLRDVIVYQSPHDGDQYVPAKTTIIVRPNAIITRRNSSSGFSFQVTGETSGIHAGKIVIADDRETVVFLPEKPFSLDEIVHVEFSARGLETSIPPLSFSFRITSMTDSEQCYNLNLLRQKEKNDITVFQQKANVKIQQNGFPLDTLPPLFPMITIDTLDAVNVAPGSVFLAPSGSNCVTIVDNSGSPLFVRQVLPNGGEDLKMELNNTLSYFQTQTILLQNIFVGTVYLLNSRYAVIDSFNCGNGYSTDDHDFRLLPNGHALLLAYDGINMDMRTVTGDSNAAKKATVFGAIIQELDNSKPKLVVRQWRSWDHFQISDMTNFDLTDPNHTLIDYAHVNSVESVDDTTILASFRHMDEVTKINFRTGKPIWRWGGKNNVFEFAGDTLQFSHQHDVRLLPNGHITMWDNGNYRKSVWGDGSVHDTTYSRAVEYELIDNGDTKATTVWEDFDVPYSFASGNVQRLPNGNTFIGYGTVSVPNAKEVTPQGKKVFQLSLPNNPYNYRTFRFQWQPNASVVPLPGTASAPGIGNIFPNPASTSATLAFNSSGTGILRVSLIDILGNEVRSEVRQIPQAGIYSLALDLHDLPNGSYYCKLIQNGNITMSPVIVRK
jgi:hypothetical protein